MINYRGRNYQGFIQLAIGRVIYKKLVIGTCDLQSLGFSEIYIIFKRLASRARPHRKTSRTNANLVYQDVINATKENLNQSVFTNKQVGQGVQRLVNKEKRGLVQREEEIEPASIKNVTYGLSFGLLLYSLYKINTI